MAAVRLSQPHPLLFFGSAIMAEDTCNDFDLRPLRKDASDESRGSDSPPASPRERDSTTKSAVWDATESINLQSTDEEKRICTQVR